MPRIPIGHRFEVVPDWVCEILSSATESKDREIKMPIYARYGVADAWLLDPRTRSVEAFALHQDQWRNVGRFTGGTTACIPPFDAVAIDLAALWDLGGESCAAVASYAVQPAGRNASQLSEGFGPTAGLQPATVVTPDH